MAIEKISVDRASRRCWPTRGRGRPGGIGGVAHAGRVRRGHALHLRTNRSRSRRRSRRSRRSATIVSARKLRAFLRSRVDAEHPATEKARPDRLATAEREPPLPLDDQDADEAARGGRRRRRRRCDRRRAPRARAPDRQGGVERGDPQEHRRAQEVPGSAPRRNTRSPSADLGRQPPATSAGSHPDVVAPSAAPARR